MRQGKVSACQAGTPAEASRQSTNYTGEQAGRQSHYRRKRKPRYPKGYDPSKPNGGLPAPDPERWLPKWQRSDAKKKQKRRRDRTVGVTRHSFSWGIRGGQGQVVLHCGRTWFILTAETLWLRLELFVPSSVFKPAHCQVFLTPRHVCSCACFSACLLTHTQEQVKGSQGAGKVDDALDRAAKADKGDEGGDKGKSGSKPQLPSRPAGKGKGGRR